MTIEHGTMGTGLPRENFAKHTMKPVSPVEPTGIFIFQKKNPEFWSGWAGASGRKRS